MPVTESALQRSAYLSMRLERNLYQAIEQDAASLGVSLSDAARMRLKTGRCPSLDTKSEESTNGR